MKIGTVAWNWTRDPLQMPAGDSLHRVADDVAALGLSSIDLIGDTNSLKNWYTDETVRSMRRHIEGLGLAIGAFVSSTPEVNHPDPEKRRAVLADYERAADICAAFGCGHLNMTVPYPGGYGMKPNDFRSPSEKFSLRLPADYSWARDWDTYTESMATCVRIAAERGLTLSIECFPYTICSSPHAWLRLIDALGQPANFGIQLDTAHLANQRHDPVTAIHMIGDRIVHVHCKDSDTMTRGNLPAGSGTVDYESVIAALRRVGYDGTLSIEVERTDNPVRYVGIAKEYLEKCLRA